MENVISRSGLTYTDKVTIITGGSKGIGEGCARVFVDAGAKVVICARGIEAGEKMAAELNAVGPGTCHFVGCDVSKAAELEHVIKETVRIHGRIDCLLNNAGYHHPFRYIDELTESDFHAILQTNIVSYFNACKYALPHLRKTKGNIINMSSLVGNMGDLRSTMYCATKGAINGFTKALAVDEARHGVRVNAVLPGNIVSYGRTHGLAAMPTELAAKTDQILDCSQITGRSGTNEEVGQLCLFLASDAAAYLTGTEIVISGGSELGYGKKYPPEENQPWAQTYDTPV